MLNIVAFNAVLSDKNLALTVWRSLYFVRFFFVKLLEASSQAINSTRERNTFLISFSLLKLFGLT